MTKASGWSILEAFQGPRPGDEIAPALRATGRTLMAGSTAPPAASRRSSRHLRRHPERHRARAGNAAATPVNAWIGGNRQPRRTALRLKTFFSPFSISDPSSGNADGNGARELIDYRLAAYEASAPRRPAPTTRSSPTSTRSSSPVPRLRIACGHFRAASADARGTSPPWSWLRPPRPPPATSSPAPPATSMNGGKTRSAMATTYYSNWPTNASITGGIMAIERPGSYR